MGACGGKLVEQEYAGYSSRKKRGTPYRSRGSGGRTRCSPSRTGAKHRASLGTKNARTKVENRHGFNIDENFMQNLKANELSALIKLMNHEDIETSTCAYEIIQGLSINEFTGSISAEPQAVKNLGVLLGSTSDEVLVGCITVLHSLVQQDEDLTTEIYIACVDNLTGILRMDAADVLCGAISLLGLMAAVDDILCDMIDKDLHEMLADRFHSTNDVVVKRQIFLALHNFMLIKNSEKAMHTKVIKILVETLQMPDDIIDPDIRISALRILSYISMSGSDYLQKMIADLGGIPTLSRLARMHDSRNATTKELTKVYSLHIHNSLTSFVQIAGMALSCLCCVNALQDQVLREWGLDPMLQFLDLHSNDSGAALAVIMAINNLLENSTFKPVIASSAYLKQVLRAIQQKTNSEDLLEECTEALSHLLPEDLKQAQQTKFEKLCTQHFSPFVPMMLRKSRTNRTNRLLPSLSPLPNAPSTRNWLLSPDRSSLSPRRRLFPRKLHLFFSPKRSSPSPPHRPFSSSPRYLSSPPVLYSPSTRRHSVSLDSMYAITAPAQPVASAARRKSIPAYSATPPTTHNKHPVRTDPPVNHPHDQPSSVTSHAPTAPTTRRKSIPAYSAPLPKIHSYADFDHLRDQSPSHPPSPDHHSLSHSLLAHTHSSRPTPITKPRSHTSPASFPNTSAYVFSSPSNSILFCSPLSSPVWDTANALPPCK
eukprot:Phypoly_transcript_03558.p1 GENE.Phypoly_transcript_03558~~Phypoly_transcript_03558.p1  ORF type:complete len:711 (+),score=99.04 Phypoly_transcript_03558:130-2262(+)